MQAVILAAGMGKQLKELTRDNTKCMVQVNGVTLISRLLHQLEGRQLSRVIIVVGYQGQKLMDYIGTLSIQTPVVFVENPIYDKTNNIYSLALAKDWLCREDTLLFKSAARSFEDEVIDLLVNDQKGYSGPGGTALRAGWTAPASNWRRTTASQSLCPGKSFRFEDRDEYYKTRSRSTSSAGTFPRPTMSPSWRPTARPWATMSTMNRCCG